MMPGADRHLKPKGLFPRVYGALYEVLFVCGVLIYVKEVDRASTPPAITGISFFDPYCDL